MTPHDAIHTALRPVADVEDCQMVVPETFPTGV